jgi:hypothetical protein
MINVKVLLSELEGYALVAVFTLFVITAVYRVFFFIFRHLSIKNPISFGSLMKLLGHIILDDIAIGFGIVILYSIYLAVNWTIFKIEEYFSIGFVNHHTTK